MSQIVDVNSDVTRPRCARLRHVQVHLKVTPTLEPRSWVTEYVDAYAAELAGKVERQEAFVRKFTALADEAS